MTWTWCHSKGVERSDASKLRADLAELGWQLLVSNGKLSMLTSTKRFWDGMWSLWSRACILMENMSFARFHAGLQCYDYPAVLGRARILDSSRLAVIFAQLEHSELFYLASSVGKNPADDLCQAGRSASVHCHWLGSGSSWTQLHDLLLIPPPPGGHLGKKALSLNRQIPNSPIHTNQYFPRLP